MRGRALLLAAGAALLCAAGEPPEPPADLVPYVHEGHLEPGDYDWMRGAFEDATPAERDAYLAIQQWATECVEAAREQIRTQLREQGFENPAIDNIGLGPLLCLEVTRRPHLAEAGMFATFQEELARAGPVANAYLAAVRIAEEASRPRTADLGSQLERRPLGEQMLRHAFTWGRGMAPDSPKLSPLGRAIFQALTGAATARRDYDNTEWLKRIVADRGWPKISEVGEEASSAAWLMAQHADHDPLFQLQVLRLMEPLVSQGEVSPQNFAYLYDRIMLKLAGEQRYATQMTCEDGVFVPQPLEQGVDVDARRTEAGLSSLEEYQALMLEAYGRCGPPGEGS